MDEINETMVEGVENVAEVISDNSGNIDFAKVGLIGFGTLAAVGAAVYIGKKFVVPGVKKGKKAIAEWCDDKKEETEAKKNKTHNYVEVEATVVEK